MEPLALKPLGARNLETAVTMARHYRDLNQPEEAESICRDVLAVAPDHEGALRTLGLALTDRFATRGATFEEAAEVFAKLSSEYDRVYFTGVAWERYGKSELGFSPHNALHAYEQALSAYARAEQLGPKDHPEPILRYNCCVRTIQTRPELRAELRRREQPVFEMGD